MKALSKLSVLESVQAPDKACEPAIPEGSLLTCSRLLNPQTGDFVAFMPSDGSPAIVRQYLVQKDGSVVLHALNRGFDSYASGLAELEASGALLTVIRMEREFPAASRSGISLVPPESAQDSRLLTFEEAQRALKVRRTKMYALLRKGELKASKVGKLWRIDSASIQEYLERQTFKRRQDK